jgi:alpha-N-arabinofuranosidase
MGVDQCARPSGSPTYPLDVLAALSADRKKLTVSVVNPTESAQELALDVTGVQLAGAGKLWQIAAPSVDTVNVAGQKPAIALMELSVSEAPNRLAVPPISVNVYEFEVR